MPRYDFRCPMCDAAFKVFRAIRDLDRPVLCPICERPAVRLTAIPMLAQFASSLRTAARPKEDTLTGRHHGHSHGPGSRPHSHGR
ncbi:MAG: hypothetical protein H0V36_11280 [Chloroflexi bacterium]|nr:hypothetical protein [Chloroflexota bacterium]